MAPPQRPPLYLYAGVPFTLPELAAFIGIPSNSLARRIERHGSADVAIAEWQKNGQGKKPTRTGT